MQKLAKKYYTPEEYLALEEAADFRSEYYQGEIFAMAGESLNHNRIAIDLCGRLNQAILNQNCEAFIENVRVWIETVKLFTYPDIVIVCGDPKFLQNRDDTIINPLIIIEVLSNSTKSYDRGDKFMLYRAIPTLREYILINQYKTQVEKFNLNENGQWVLSEYLHADDVLDFSSVNFHINLTGIYARVQLNT